MNTFEPADPFLREVREAFVSRDGKPVDATRINGLETLQIRWMPELEHGVLFQGLFSDGWDQDTGNTGKRSELYLEVASDRRVAIRDEWMAGVACVECTLRSADELPEFLEFFTTARAERIGSSGLVRRPLSTLIEEFCRETRGS